MAGDWMKMEKVTPRKPEVLEMAGTLKLSPDEIFGKLFRLWAWADDHTEDGNAHGVTRALLDSTIGVTGFANAMAEVDWLRDLEKSDQFPRGGVTFANFDRHNGKTAKKRAQTASRVAKHKAVKVTTANATSVTKALPREEKRREEKNTITHTRASKQILGKHGDSEEFCEWWERWCSWLREITGNNPSPTQADVWLMSLSAVTTEKAIANLKFSIEKGAKSILDSDDDFSKQRKQKQTISKPNAETWAR